ncbi:hypothetical protein LJR034_002687 [Caballeronia sp. LjRoot34]|uniref:hypothetical protein n=1 Tax=Caballeronia sp. LjRoot34 TaxID=3342325 RepID=UPI003ED0EB6E
MNEFWGLLPKGGGGWFLLAASIFIYPLVTASIRDRISKPAASWLGRSALWLVTSGFRTSRDRLFRDVGQRKIEPAGATIYVLLTFVAAAWFGYSVSMYQNVDMLDGSYEQRVNVMTPEELAIEGKQVREERARLGRLLAVGNFGLSGVMLLLIFSASVRRKIVANSVMRFEHVLAICLPRLSIQEEREMRASFAMIGSYEDYLRIVAYLFALATSDKGTLELATPTSVPVDPTD